MHILVTYVRIFSYYRFWSHTKMLVVNEFQTDKVQRKNFPSKHLLFTFVQKAVEELLCHLLWLLQIEADCLVKSGQICTCSCFVSKTYPLGPSRDWTAIAKFCCRQNRGLELKAFIWPQGPSSGFCLKIKIWIFVAYLFPIVHESFTDDQNQRVSFVCYAGSWNGIYEWCRCKCVPIIRAGSESEVWFLLRKVS